MFLAVALVFLVALALYALLLICSRSRALGRGPVVVIFIVRFIASFVAARAVELVLVERERVD